jgi:endonuclease I/V8-like Glu-specific endopeptidase
MVSAAQMLTQTEHRYAERRTEREKGAHAIRAGRLLQADTPDRVRARLRRLGMDERIVEAVLTTRPDRAVEDISRAVIELSKRREAKDRAGGSSEWERDAPWREQRPATGTLPPPSTIPGQDLNDILFERIIGRSDLLGISYMDRGLRASRAVGCVRLFQNGRHIGSGTGFMVSPRLLLTNNHVLTDAETGREARIVFNFQDDSEGNALPAVTFVLAPERFFLTNQPLDFSLIAVAERSVEGIGIEEFGWPRLIQDEGKVINGEYVTIVQHPNGQPKQIALRENQIIDMLENFIHYHTDTAPGSSGSPLFNDQWEVVGLHHSGVPKRDDQGRILTRHNTLWTEDMDDGAIDWIANEGVRISRIVQHIKNQSLDNLGRRLRDEMFEAAPTMANPTPDIPGGGAFGSARIVPALGTPHISEGVATWTIPLSISIQIPGARLIQDLSDHPGIGSTKPVQPSTTQPLPAPTSAALDEELRASLKEAGEARTRPYYDKTVDARDKKSYYAGLSPSLSPGKLFIKLSELISSTHATTPGYKPSKELYPWIDLRPNRKLRSIYSGKEFEPEELIREDFRIEQERGLRMRELALQESTLTASQFSQELDLLEAALPYNCEHVVPQSWFWKKEPMRGDLHHLFACESGCNSFRGNTPYFDFPDFEEVTRNECGKREDNKFEPSGGKGAVARATFYFLLRYPGEINATAKEYTKDRMATQLQWHQAFPVDDYERHRNQAIFRRQGNRNPLIDHPEWAKNIKFDRGLGD